MALAPHPTCDSAVDRRLLPIAALAVPIGALGMLGSMTAAAPIPIFHQSVLLPGDLDHGPLASRRHSGHVFYI